MSTIIASPACQVAAHGGNFAPTDCDFVFEGPGRIRLESDFVPGKGLLIAPDKPLVPGTNPN